MRYSLLCCALVALPLMTIGCSRNSELHDAMEEMKGAYKQIRESADPLVLKNQLDEFKQAFSRARVQQVLSTDQPIFEEGMQELDDLLSEAERALDEEEFAEAVALFKRMGDVRKKFHDKLGVD